MCPFVACLRGGAEEVGDASSGGWGGGGGGGMAYTLLAVLFCFNYLRRVFCTRWFVPHSNLHSCIGG